MDRLNRDAVVAIVLLAFCGVMFWASFDIRQPDYGTLPPSTWPRVILALLTILSLIFLVQSIRRGPDSPDEKAERPANLREWLHHWRNPFWCFTLFFAYLALLPVLGMLIAGIVFVFVLLGMLGGWNRRDLVLHAAVAVVSVGAMWSVFTFGLGVLLPAGMILDPY